MFKYCIWLLPELNSPLYKLTNGFRPHISIQTHLSKSEANELFEALHKVPVHINLSKKYKQTETNGFYAYYHYIKKYKEYHISFSYDKTEDIHQIYDKIDFSTTYIFDKYEIVYCNHKDYTKWYKIDLKKK